MEKPTVEMLFKLFENSPLSEFEYSSSDFSLKMKSDKTVQVSSSIVKTQNDETASKNNSNIISSPIVATFYITSNPDSPAFVKEGDIVQKGDVLCILEAMKMMNEFRAEFSCKILKVLAQPGALVEYGAPLFSIEKL